MNMSKEALKLRARTGLTQPEFAAQLGVHGQYVSNVERGTTFYSPCHFKRISQMTGVSVEKLVRLLLKRKKEEIMRKVERGYES